jgi:hypothetical protein
MLDFFRGSRIGCLLGLMLAPVLFPICLLKALLGLL